MKKICLVLMTFFCFFTSFSQTEKNIVDFLFEFYEAFYDLTYEVQVKKREYIADNLARPFLIGNDVFSVNKLAASPVSGKNSEIVITSFFGHRNDKMHYGVDIICAYNLDTIYAVWDGYGQAYIDLGKSKSYGNYIVIKHDQDSETIYAHLKVIASKFYNGSEVKKGEIIGIMGNTGCYKCGKHLHFEIKYKGIPINPINDENQLFMDIFPIRR